uniref:Uncharacterized mitochondrial protein AtMg00810-like n=1 Tax=Tanacetum cinerariifolium TaxID=118510 RepID=A0A6L2M1U9_TANCI|nr:uncharacterized mitochondrial protein AtMg00810-like [Tanacetum cinerariifolium]
MGLGYSKDSGFELIAYIDADHAGCNDDGKSTSGGIQFLGDKLVSWLLKNQDCTAITVIKVPNPKDTIKFMLDTKEFTYTVDMFRVTLHLPVETPENPFVAPVNIQTIEAFMNRVGYQGEVDKKKINILQLFHAVINRTNVGYANLLWWDFMNNVFQKKEAIQIDEDYHSIKDDSPLVSVYTTGNVLVRGMLILDECLTEKIRDTDDFKDYEMVFVRVDVPMNQPQLVVSIQGTHRTTPRAHMTPTISTTRTSKNVTDDDEEIEKEKNNEEIEKEKKDKEIEKERILMMLKKRIRLLRKKMLMLQRKVSSSDETVSEELTTTVSPTTATTSKYLSTSKCKKKSISYKSKILPKIIVGMCRRRGQIRSHIKNKFVNREFFMSKIREVLDHCNNVVPELTFAKTNEIINKEMPCLVNLAVNKDREVDPINAQEMISKEFSTHVPKMIEELF